MKANREYELMVRRGGRGPALFAAPDRVDLVEVVEIATGEVALFWNTVPAQTRRLARGLRADLAQLEADAFIAKWRRWQVA
jgi:enhancing lycopene biosynthesis protein 2